jgi:hypothetical protein
MPGMNRAPNVAALPTTAATRSVFRAPINPAAGAVKANETGKNPIEINQSRLDTRPRSEGGT